MGTDAGTNSESRISEYEALQTALRNLGEALAAPDSEAQSWAAQLQVCIRAAVSAFERHRDSAEAPNGNLARAAEVKPSLARWVERLKEEHLEIIRKGQRFDGLISELLRFENIPKDRFRLEGGMLRDSILLHMMLGAQLLYEMYFQEEGGEG